MKMRNGSGRRLAAELGFVLAIGVMSIGPSVAEDSKPPFIETYVSFEVEDDWTYDSDDPGNELNDLYTTVEPTLVMHFTEGLSLTAHGVLEPVRDP